MPGLIQKQTYSATILNWNDNKINKRVVLVVEEPRVPGENHGPWVSNW